MPVIIHFVIGFLLCVLLFVSDVIIEYAQICMTRIFLQILGINCDAISTIFLFDFILAFISRNLIP